MRSLSHPGRARTSAGRAENRAQRALADGATQADQDRARAAYYGLCTFVDRQVEQLLAALNRNGMADRTIVVYTSDHGDQIGEHGLWWRSTFYEGSVGVPLLVAGPGIPRGAAIGSNVSLLDVGATLLDLLGLPTMPHAEGLSFRCLLDGRPKGWPDLVLAEGASLSPKPRAMRMARRGPWKLNLYAGHAPELFHLIEDPDETTDRAADPTCSDVLQELTAQALRGWDAEEIERRMVSRSAELDMIRTHLLRAQPPEPYPLWCLEPQENWVFSK